MGPSERNPEPSRVDGVEATPRVELVLVSREDQLVAIGRKPVHAVVDVQLSDVDFDRRLGTLRVEDREHSLKDPLVNDSDQVIAWRPFEPVAVHQRPAAERPDARSVGSGDHELALRVRHASPEHEPRAVVREPGRVVEVRVAHDRAGVRAVRVGRHDVAVLRPAQDQTVVCGPEGSRHPLGSRADREDGEGGDRGDEQADQHEPAEPRRRERARAGSHVHGEPPFGARPSGRWRVGRVARGPRRGARARGVPRPHGARTTRRGRGDRWSSCRAALHEIALETRVGVERRPHRAERAMQPRLRGPEGDPQGRRHGRATEGRGSDGGR